jgi:uncharacterized protein (TIGR03118 family)
MITPKQTNKPVRSGSRSDHLTVSSILYRGWAAVILLALAPVAAATDYAVTNLVSDIPGLAAYTDPNLVNPWGFTASPTSPFWVANNGTGVATLYNGSGQPQPLVITVPPAAGGASPSSPTGVAFNSGTGFEVQPGSPARFLFATEDGTISGWSSVSITSAVRLVDNSAGGADYKGVAIGSGASGTFLYAANFAAGTIDVFNSVFAPTALAGGFTDPILPSGYAPFNIQSMGGNLLVTYALQDANRDVVAGAGNGFVDVFDTAGNFVRRLIGDGALNSPWGLALAPADFGEFGNDLLVGNFGDGRVNAFDPLTGDYQGTLLDSMGLPITIDGLRGLNFGNGGNGGDTSTLYFAAGIAGGGLGVGAHGLFGSIAPVPVPSTLLLMGSGLSGLLVAARRRQRGNLRAVYA